MVVKSRMAVSDEYRERIQKWAQQESARFASKTDTGLNEFSRQTEVVLAQYGLKGFKPAALGRWRNGEVTQELREETLKRIGLYRGLSKDPTEAQRRAYNWLHGFPDPGQSKGVSSDSPLTADTIISFLTKQATRDEQKQIAIAAVEMLAIVEPAAIEEEEMPEANPNSQLALFILGWLSRNDAAPADLAAEAGIDEAVIASAIEGYTIDAESCEALAAVFNLQPETLATWGACQVPQ